MHKTFKPSDIYILKQQLNDSIVNNNYNLLSPEVIYLSKQLDLMLLPIFENQLDVYKNSYPN
ncbi:MAG: Spo0E family sporulation regulatory protein-aspartic acid phosphatase [Cellulosilyticaceae bacterium]